MGRITEVKKIKNTAVLLVDGFTKLRIRYADFEKTGLFAGDCFDEDELFGRLAASQFADAYEAALTCLDSADKTRDALIKKLMNAGFVPPCAEAVADKLEQNGLIDDSRIAARVVESARHNGAGYYAVRRKLLSKGISADDAEEALSAVDPGEQLAAAREAAEKYRRKYENEDPRKARAKVSQALARKGFSWPVISEAMEDMTFGDEWE